jgi:hypothetical protein
MYYSLLFNNAARNSNYIDSNDDDHKIMNWNLWKDGVVA